MQDQFASVIFFISGGARAIDVIQDIVAEIRPSKRVLFGRTRITSNPSGDQNMVTIRFGPRIVSLGIVAVQLPPASIFVRDRWLNKTTTYHLSRNIAILGASLTSVSVSDLSNIQFLSFSGPLTASGGRPKMINNKTHGMQTARCRLSSTLDRRGQRTDCTEWGNPELLGNSFMNSIVDQTAASR
jgi:hypothetical protein